MAHEIKVSRADLLSDLRKPAKAAACREASGMCWYEIQRGIAEPEEIPIDYGVLISDTNSELTIARAAPRVHQALPFGTWMSLARAAPLVFDAKPAAEFAEVDANTV